MDQKSYREIIGKSRAWYKDIGRVYCPALKCEVVFNAKGFHHLLFDGLGFARSPQERMSRLKLLPLAVEIIKNTKLANEYRVQTNSGKNVEYWSLKSEKRGSSIVVIARKIGTGETIFYSVWGKQKTYRK